VKDIHDVITQAKFGDNRLRGLGVVAGQISAFPIDFAGRPYNTLTLPCERVMLCYCWAKIMLFTYVQHFLWWWNVFALMKMHVILISLYWGGGCFLLAVPLTRPHPQHLNFFVKKWKFSVEINACQEGTKINIEVDEW